MKDHPLETRQEYNERLGNGDGTPPPAPPPAPTKKGRSSRPSLRDRKGEKKEEKPGAMEITKDGLIPLDHPFYSATKPATAREQIFDSLKEVGKGSFGVVYEGTNRENNEKNAIKVGVEAVKMSSDKKFKEVEALWKVPAHENLLKLLFAFVDGGLLNIVTELCQTNLFKYSARGLDENEVLRVLREVGSGLGHLHSLDLLHNDIKSENILVSQTGKFLIGDFGQMTDVKAIGFSAGDEGDSRYLAPEVLTLQKPSKASDVFSLGMTVLEIATNLHLPNGGANRNQILKFQIPSRFFNNVSADLQDLIRMLMHEDAESRPSCEELLKHPLVQVGNTNKETFAAESPIASPPSKRTRTKTPTGTPKTSSAPETPKSCPDANVREGAMVTPRKCVSTGKAPKNDIPTTPLRKKKAPTNSKMSLCRRAVFEDLSANSSATKTD